jgi:hypothetical protein
MMVSYWMEAYTIKNNTEVLVAVFKEAGLDVSAEEIKLRLCLAVSAGQSHGIRTGIKSFERVEQFK